MYSIKLLIHYLMVKGKLAFGEAEDNTIQRGISYSIKSFLIFYVINDQIIFFSYTMLLCSFYLERKT